MSQTPKNNQGPVDTLRNGALKAAIWKNTGSNGDFYNVRITRTYRKQSGEYGESSSFSRNELLQVALIATEANKRIHELAAGGESA